MHDAPEAGRRRHFDVFYGDASPPEGFGLVIGNCQAESLRLVLDSPDVPTVRTPPVHELTADDTRHLHALLARASFLVAQPVHDDYHGLPLGTRQLRAALPSSAGVVTITPIRFGGLHPFQAVLRIPGVDEIPPIVDYHDVRTLAAAAGLPIAETLPAAAVRAISDDSLAELRRREARTDIVVSDVFASPSFAQMRTINHPANDVFLSLGARILAALGRDAAPTDPGRPLLSAVEAPREQWVADAWGSDEIARAEWTVHGLRVRHQSVRDAHREWYAAHPRVVAAAVPRVAQLLRRWRSA